MKSLLLTLTLSSLLLSGCQLTRVQGQVDDIDVDIKKTQEQGNETQPKTKHCPPGHAKKGWC
ncbi:hypothetical protein [Oceanospirillum sediminis]|uniref:Lipoprotein n=1 Tax=Oceanospirillum sediminis TaxID=2760088 RepID=A0A839IXW4_9GAMM|nr:hypothetical protein [Oceanospirillum sediminis]MBB1489217.1 hypothetical protein [Oceanospirillum sediminis]